MVDTEDFVDIGQFPCIVTSDGGSVSNLTSGLGRLDSQDGYVNGKPTLSKQYPKHCSGDVKSHCN